MSSVAGDTLVLCCHCHLMGDYDVEGCRRHVSAVVTVKYLVIKASSVAEGDALVQVRISVVSSPLITDD